MANDKGKLEGLEGFERLDMGELYFIGSRTFVERGLAYYRQFAVEAFEWDERAKRLTAVVAGRRGTPYEVWLRVREGRLEHECDCPAWSGSGGCKHAVAAAAAMFLAVQGKLIGGIDMPADYAQMLRRQLGFHDVNGGKRSGQRGGREPSPGPKTELVLDEVNRYGSLRFEIKGPVPEKFLRSVGITLANDFGFYGSRHFHMGNAEESLRAFVEKAGREGVVLTVRVAGQTHPLSLGPEDCRLKEVYDLEEGGEVLRSLEVRDGTGVRLEPYALIERSSWILLEDGRLCRVEESEDEELAWAKGPLSDSIPADVFRRRGWLLDYGWMADNPDEYEFLVDGERASVKVFGFTESCGVLDLAVLENAANEPETLQFGLSLQVGDNRVDLEEFCRMTLDCVLHAHGGNLLSAKRRVRALFDLIRRILADAVDAEHIEFDHYREEFPELFSENYRRIVFDILRSLMDFVASVTSGHRGLGVDRSRAGWFAYPFDGAKFAMILFGMAEPGSRRELIALAEGRIPIRRGASGMEELRQAVAAARALGVEVRFNELPVHTEKLSISVDTRTSGSDIDWFALHPSVHCGERTIGPDEWRSLIQGELLLKGADGSLIMPEMDEGGEAGLKALADMLKGRQPVRAGESNGGDEGLSVSRLEMLDWIALRRHGVGVRLPKEAEALFTSLTKFRGLGDFSKPADFHAELRPYQSEGCAWIEFLYRHRFGACLADDMGLGKTVQTIGFLTRRFEDGLVGRDGAPVLIVLPPSLVFNWLDEFRRFSPGLKVMDCLSKDVWAKALKNAQVVLTTYDRIRTDAKKLQDHHFEILVFDEAHNLKNVAAARTKAAAKISRRFTLCLTGTPVENNASEFYSVMTAAVPGLFGTLKQFKETFLNAPNRLLGRSRPFILRRTKGRILKELPKKEEHELHLEMSSLQKEIYTRTVAEVRKEVAEAYEDKPEQQAGIVALAAILRLRQVCVSPELLGKAMPEPAPKFAYLGDKLEELESEGHAALVFSQFIGGLDRMEAVAEARGIQFLRMDGRTPVAERKDLVGRFQDSNGPSFFFISLKTGGVGLNLTRANYVFHIDPWWNPAVENQASDRAHRIGQTRSVFVQRLIMEHSIEARMLELKARKAELFRQLVDDPGVRTAKAGLTREDFDYLLKG